jgi:hypothetical protein
VGNGDKDDDRDAVDAAPGADAVGADTAGADDDGGLVTVTDGGFFPAMDSKSLTLGVFFRHLEMLGVDTSTGAPVYPGSLSTCSGSLSRAPT